MRPRATTAAKVSGVVGAASAVAAWGLPMAIGLAVVLVVVVGAVCWVVADRRRTGNLTELIHAARGTAPARPPARSSARGLQPGGRSPRRGSIPEARTAGR